MRTSKIDRTTKETDISVKLNIDGTGAAKIQTPIGFLSHMLETFARHGLFDLEISVKGDLHVDQHHTVEDCGIVLGEAFKQALSDKKGIQRAGFFVYPMDEALARVAVDISGRPFLAWQVPLNNVRTGELEVELLEDFFLGFSNTLGLNLHVVVEYGRSDHHKIEAVFKALAKAMKLACQIEPRIAGQIPSTKGII